MSESHLYRVWHGDENNRSELARFRAVDIDKVIDYVKANLLKPNSEIELEDGDDEHLYLIFNPCQFCEYFGTEDDEEICEGCESSEYIEIELDDDIEPDLRTIYGTTEFYDLTLPTGHEKKQDWLEDIALMVRYQEKLKEYQEKRKNEILEENR